MLQSVVFFVTADYFSSKKGWVCLLQTIGLLLILWEYLAGRESR
jgi:accessory gene regulator protein AgrB